MFNKFKKGEIVIICGIGKLLEEKYVGIGIIIEKDDHFKDYCVRLEDGTEEWFDEEYLEKI